MSTAFTTFPKIGAARYAALILLLDLLPNVRADDCWIDRFGREHCRLSTGARVGIAVAIVVLMILILIAIIFHRRRRVRRANQAFVNTQSNYVGGHPGGPPGGAQSGPYAAGYAPNYGQNGYGSPQPQYPPQTLNDTGNGYDMHGGFAPPSGPPPAHVQQQEYPPPQYFPPPNGPPPEAKM